jgi:hypothetical protein
MTRSILSAALALFTTISVFAQEPKVPSEKEGLMKLDQKNGFREMVLGSELKEADFQELGKKGDVAYYTRPSDSKTIGTAQLDDIQYRYYKGQLSAVVIKTKGYANSTKVKETLQLQYGMPQQVNKYIPKFTWTGKKTLMTMEQNATTKDATITIASKALLEQEENDLKAAPKKATDDL